MVLSVVCLSQSAEGGRGAVAEHVDGSVGIEGATGDEAFFGGVVGVDSFDGDEPAFRLVVFVGLGGGFLVGLGGGEASVGLGVGGDALEAGGLAVDGLGNAEMAGGTGLELADQAGEERGGRW